MSELPGFLEELKRRKAVRVGLIYLTAAWAALQVAELLLPALGAPDWVFRGLVILVAVGLIPALIVAWAFEITRDGVKRTVDAEATTWLSTRTVVAVLALVAFAAAAGWWFGESAATDRAGGRGAAALPMSESAIAVLPFTVRASPDLAYLGEGLVDLLSAKLHGLGDVQAVNPRLVVARAEGSTAGASRPDAARRVAEAVGAGRYVTGDVLEVAGRLTLTAYLHETANPRPSPVRASVEGNVENLFDLLDRLAADLMAASMPAGGSRLAKLATLTTPSLPALKEYLQGEQLLRDGAYRDAAEAYDRAVALDSTFALALYRKTIAADWTDAYDVRSSADRALALSGSLPANDRALLEAVALRRNGRVDEAEQAFRTLLHNNPDDVEALVQYGELLFHDVARKGRPTMAASAPFARAIELEPRNLIARVHIARLYALDGSVDRLRETGAYLREVAPASERGVEVDAMHAFLVDDYARQREIESRIVSEPWYYQFYATLAVFLFARDAAGAAELLAARPPDDPYTMALVPLVGAARGRPRATLAYLDSLRPLQNPTWDLYDAHALTTGALGDHPERARSLLERLRRADPTHILRSSWAPPYEDVTAALVGFERDFYLALLLIDLGRMDEARTVLARMRETPDFRAVGTLKRDALLSLDAELQLAAGDSAGALGTYRRMTLDIPHALTVRSMPDQSRARFVHAELERTLGDIDAAKGLYLGLDESWSPWDAFYRARVYERLGAIAEREGRPRDAILHYSRLIEQWQDADPDVVEQRARVVERRDRLVRETG